MGGNCAGLHEPDLAERVADAVRRATPVLLVLVVLLSVVAAACAESPSAGGARRVSATVLDAAGPAYADDNALVAPPTVARAVWLSPDGSARVGAVPVHRGADAGQVVSVWVDDHGSVVPAPPTGALPVLTGLLWAAVGTLLVLGTRVTTRAWSARRRARAWAREWADVEPVLSGRELRPRRREQR